MNILLLLILLILYSCNVIINCKYVNDNCDYIINNYVQITNEYICDKCNIKIY